MTPYLAELHSAHLARRARFAAFREPPPRSSRSKIIKIGKDGRQVLPPPPPPPPAPPPASPPMPEPAELPNMVNGRIRAAIVLQLVAEEFQVTVADLTSPSHFQRFVRPRHAAMWLLRRSGYSCPAAGRALGGRNHTTILHGTWRVNNRMTADAEFAARMEMLLECISGKK